MSIFMFISFAIMLLVGFPMFLVMFIPTITALPIFFPNLPAFSVIQSGITGMMSFPLVAIPLFIFAADIMMMGEMSKRLIRFAETLVGHFTGGMAHATILTCLIFGAVSGSTMATVAAVGSNVKPALLKKGYKESFVMALLINASDVALLIPPSITLIIYGVIAETSIASLFLAGLIPGIFLGFAFMIYSWWWAKKNKVPRLPRASVLDILTSTKDAIGPLGFVFIIIGGIYSGVFSPTEAAGVSVGYALLLEGFVYRSIGLRDIYKVALRSGTTTALTYICIGGAYGCIWLLTFARIPHHIMELLLAVVDNRMMLLFVINIAFFIALMFFSPVATVLILTPLFLPVIEAYHVDPVHLGILVCLNCAIGSATPPYGVDIFAACAIFRLPYERVVSGILPFILCGIIVLVCVTIFPDIALFIPRLVF